MAAMRRFTLSPTTPGIRSLRWVDTVPDAPAVSIVTARTRNSAHMRDALVATRGARGALGSDTPTSTPSAGRDPPPSPLTLLAELSSPRIMLPAPRDSDNTPKGKRDPVLAFLKFGTKLHMDEFVREGHLFMRPLAEFVAMEQDTLRGDKHEGLTSILQADGCELSCTDVNGIWRPVGKIVGPVGHRDPGALNSNVFCMYALRGSRVTSWVDPRNRGFGDAFVILMDGDEFLRRVRTAAEREGIPLDWGPVEYVDPLTYSGRMGPFRKLSTHAYQSEFRLVIKPGTGQLFSLWVGSLKDIAIVGPSDEVNDRFRFKDGRLSFRNI